MNNVLLSVRLMTYNHEEYIANAIEGCLAQKTDFRFEIVIGDDFSTDETLKICLEYQQQYPGIIKVLKRKKYDDYYIRREHNGRLENFIDIIQNCAGKYIALLDGDDYWTDPYKLQKQVDFLEANPEYSICFHPVQVLKDGVFEKDDLRKVDETTSIEDLAKGNYIHTPSVVFRNGLFNLLDPIFYKVPVGDYLIHMLNAKNGLIKKLDGEMAVYRKHDQGIWSKTDKITIAKRWMLQMDLMMPQFTDFPEVHVSLEKQRSNCVKAIRRNKKLIRIFIRIKDSLIYRLNLKRNTNIDSQW